MAIYPHPNLPSYLYKYTSTVSGKAILENGTLRFSRPSCFNDGFDLRINLEIEADSNRAITEIINNLWESANNTTVSFANNDLGNLLRSLRNFQWAAERYPDFVEFMRPTVKMQVENRTESLRKFNESVVKECANRKVLCLSETPISAPLWGNYAENLSGMALKFSPTLDINSLFLLAKPIKYVQGAPHTNLR